MAKLERLTEEVELMACEAIANGDSFKAVSEKMGLTQGQLVTYRRLFPDFQMRVAEAKESLCEDLEDDLLQIPHKYDKDTAKLLSANTIKYLEFNNPKRYSPRQQFDMSVTIDIAGALDRAEQRVIDVVATNVVPLLNKKA